PLNSGLTEENAARIRTHGELPSLARRVTYLTEPAAHPELLTTGCCRATYRKRPEPTMPTDQPE
ncbi:MAG: hypothetical protein Q7J43_01185, partial [Pseudomonas sp.]|uniref:hypothetical protein n=1 Tax=Pseudomonas sp. TaxID=306 RepID=UPI00271CCA02